MKSAAVCLGILFCTTLQAQQQFTNNGNFRIHSGASVTVYGDFINNGNFVDSSNVLTLKGTTAQQIGGTSLTTFKNLTLNNTMGSYLSSNQSIIGELNVTSGTFSTTGYDFKLISDANGTARIAPILGNFAGNITMERYISGTTSWRFLSSPVIGATLADWQDDFITSGYPGSAYPNFNFTSIYSYDENAAGIADNGYLIPSSSSDPITPGNGYWCYIGPAPVTVNVTGPPSKFTQTFQVSYTPSGGSAEDGYVMIGNPYPCPIDWSSASWTKSKINDAIYIWNPALQQYASWVSGTTVNGGSNLIASSQSFWIQTNGANPTLSCNENVKVSSNTTFLKPPPSTFENLKLIIEGNGFNDETLLRFGNTSTNGYDSDADARKLFSTNALVPGIATQDSTLRDMSVNSLPLVSSTVHIPLKTLAGASGNYTILADSTFSLSTGFCLILEDLATGIKTNLSNAMTYTFFLADTTKAARFVIHISAPHQTEAIPASCNNYQNGKAVATPKGAGAWNYTWYNSLSTIIKQTFNSFSADTLQNVTAGTYTVHISDVNTTCGSFDKEIIITQPAPVIASFEIIDTLSVNEGLNFQNTSSGALSYLWDFGDSSAEDSSMVPQTHMYANAGQYQVKLIALNTNCSDTLVKSITVLKANTVGLLENSISRGVSVYPNPSNGIFFVQMLESDKSILSIYGSSGEILSQQKLSPSKTEFNLQHLAKGLYLYKVSLPERSYIGRLIIQ